MTLTTKPTKDDADASHLSDNDENGDTQAAAKKADGPKNSKPRRHLRNWWKVYLLGTVVLLAILLPILYAVSGHS